jgi:hypothetical protein
MNKNTSSIWDEASSRNSAVRIEGRLAENNTEGVVLGQLPNVCNSLLSRGVPVSTA